MLNLRNVGIFAHPKRSNTIPLAEQVAHSLESRGIQTWIRRTSDEAIDFVSQCDLVIAIGGDGAMLRTARLCAPFNIPILGMNTGHLGFLTEVMPDDWEETLPHLLEGRYWIEKRMMIHGEIWQNGNLLTTEDALNDIVIGRGSAAHSVQLEAYIDGAWTTTYNTDGLIISTATGSTAYALAAGGPILPPELHNIMLVAVAPHLSMDRPLVLPHGVDIKVVIASSNHDPDVIITADGRRLALIGIDDYIIIRASERFTQFVRLRERGYFFRSILDRLEPRLVKRRIDPEMEQE